MRNFWKLAIFGMVLMQGAAQRVGFAQTAGEKAPSVEEKKTEDKALELPWTLEEIKKDMKVGQKTQYKLTVRTVGSSGSFGLEHNYHYNFEITEVNEKGYKLTTTLGDGKEDGESSTKECTWESIGKGYKFTESDTKVSEGKCKVAAGEFDCKIYTQTTKADGTKNVSVYYFIMEKPGKFARIEVNLTDSDGKSAGSQIWELVKIE